MRSSVLGRVGLVALLLAGSLALATEVSTPRLVRVAAASDLQFAIPDLRTAFASSRPDVEVQVTLGSSGNFFSQLKNQAPFDVFLSADVEYPRLLVEQGICRRGSQFSYAVGRLVLFHRTSLTRVPERGWEVLMDPAVRKIALANPAHAPYGRAAEAALKSTGILEKVRSKLVLGDNVAQTAQFVQSGAADVGFISLSLAQAPALKDSGAFWEVPSTDYPRMEQGGCITTWAKDAKAAHAFTDFVRGEDGAAILRKNGFIIPAGSPR